MGATTSLASKQLSATPGGSTSCKVQVRNSGTLVDQFSIDIVGDARGWTDVEPRVMNLMPGQDGEVTVTFSPPRDGTVHAGVVPFGVRVLSREEPAGSVVEEGSVAVEPYANLQVDLSPKTSRGRSKARHDLVVDNAGNFPIAVELVTNDPEDQLRLSIDHTALTVAPGTSAFLKLVARPHDRFLRGAERRHPFQVTALSPDAPPTTVDGVVVQQQLLPKWLLPALIALLTLAVLLATLWFTVMRPTVQSAAREAAKQQAADDQAQVKAAADKASAQAAQADQTAKDAKAVADKAASGGGSGPTTPAVVGPGNVDLSKGVSTDFRIVADAPTTANVTDFKTFEPNPALPADKTVVVTDIVLQNPKGDSGTMQIRRGNQVLLEVGLNNFRDLDYHFLQPWTFAPGQKVVIAVSCQTAGAGSGNCKPAVSFSGRFAG